MKKINWILLVSAILIAFSCTDLTELNENPTKSNNMEPDLLIPTIQMSHSHGYNNMFRHMSYPGGFTNLWTGTWAIVEYGGKGKKDQAYMERLWGTFYPTAVKNNVDLMYMTKNNPKQVNLHAMAKVMNVELFLRITDYYGDIPYSEAGRAYHEGIIKPKYDKQEDIYNDFFKELKEAVEMFDESARVPAYDLYYHGDITKWKRFANSLRLRIAMRLVKVDPARAEAEAKAAYEAGLMQSNDDICFVQHEQSSLDLGPGNGYANCFLQRASDCHITDELVAALTVEPGVYDPRLLMSARAYAENSKVNDVTDQVFAANGEFWGSPAQDFPYGGGVGNENPWKANITVTLANGSSLSINHRMQRLRPSNQLSDTGSAWIHLSYAETQLLLAEAAIRGWISNPTKAEEFYKKAVEAGIRQYSILGVTLPTNETIQNYVNSLPSLGAGNAALEEINKQLWINHILDPCEAWANIRRTGMPSKYVKFYNRYPGENETDGKAPRRMQYPLDEQLKNPENYKEAVNRMGGSDSWMTPVWWDKD